jgi:hypothetical protein
MEHAAGQDARRLNCACYYYLPLILILHAGVLFFSIAILSFFARRVKF